MVLPVGDVRFPSVTGSCRPLGSEDYRVPPGAAVTLDTAPGASLSYFFQVARSFAVQP